MRNPLAIIIAALAALLVTYAVSYQVRFNEVAVRVRFGKAQATITEPGFGFKLPYPIETIKTYDRRLQMLETQESECPTADGQNLIVGLFALWRIEDPLLYHIRSGGSDAVARDAFSTRLNEARKTIIGRYPLSSLFNLDAATVESSRDKIESEIAQLTAPGLLADFGVRLERVRVRRNAMPDDATKQIQEAMAAERATLATRYTEEGKSTAETIKARARASRDQILAFAGRRAEEIKAGGVKASARIIEQVNAEDADLFIWLRRLDALKAALKEKATIFLDSSSELFETFSRPYEAVGKPSGAATQPAPGH